MFDMFHLFISSHPHIIMFLGSCALACFLASSHSHILIFMCTSLYPRILTSSYPQVHVPLLAPCILISSGLCVLACIIESSHSHILSFMCAYWYPCILTSSDPQVYMCLPVCSHPQVSVFSIRMNDCIFASSSSLFLGNCASHFVNNLQIFWTGQASVWTFTAFQKSANLLRINSFSKMFQRLCIDLITSIVFKSSQAIYFSKKFCLLQIYIWNDCQRNI